MFFRYDSLLYICVMAKKKSSSKKKPFIRPDDPHWNPDDEVDYLYVHGDDNEDDAPDESSQEPPVVNEIFLQSFIETFQPERNEKQEFVRALSMGELRDTLQIYRTFDSHQPDPLPFYLAALANHGFGVRMGSGGEQVMLVSRRNNGRAMEVGEEYGD